MNPHKELKAKIYSLIARYCKLIPKASLVSILREVALEVEADVELNKIMEVK